MPYLEWDVMLPQVIISLSVYAPHATNGKDSEVLIRGVPGWHIWLSWQLLVSAQAVIQGHEINPHTGAPH